jgi:SAM-dependent methyltransferase
VQRDTGYSDADVAALYDVLNAWGPSDDFHLARLMPAATVLDVGCGTGQLLHRARRDGHTGRLVGVDPDTAALARARVRDDVEWITGTAAALGFRAEFQHALMASNAFQCLVADDDIRDSLAAVRAALVDGGTFAFETRNPLAREWESWHAALPSPVVDHAGRQLLVSYQVEEVGDGVVAVAETTAEADGTPLRVDRAQLRFLDVARLDAALAAADFTVTERYGDFTGGPWRPDSRTIVTVAVAG